MSTFEQHDLTWSDRLQDFIDGDTFADERAALESHVGSCMRCRAQLAALKRMDARLHAALPHPVLDRSFDHELLARIDSFDARSRERARRRIELEMQENLQALHSSWRRGLIFVAGGAIAGIAAALACIQWVDATGIANSLAAGSEYSAMIHTFVTAGIGALIGGGVSRWLAAAIE